MQMTILGTAATSSLPSDIYFKISVPDLMNKVLAAHKIPAVHA